MIHVKIRAKIMQRVNMTYNIVNIMILLNLYISGINQNRLSKDLNSIHDHDFYDNSSKYNWKSF